MTLRELAEQIAAKRYANIPKHAWKIVKFSDSGANELSKAILGYFELKGIKANRQSSEGRYIQGKEYTDWAGRKKRENGKYIQRSKASVGSGDITVTLPPLGRRLDIEVKYGKDRQSDVQKKFQSELEAMGGIYIIVRTWEDFYHQITKIVPTEPSNETK